MKFQKENQIITMRTTRDKHKKLKSEARAKGMTITGLIRVALKKTFSIDI